MILPVIATAFCAALIVYGGWLCIDEWRGELKIRTPQWLDDCAELSSRAQTSMPKREG